MMDQEENQIGTLSELNVKPGDVVEHICFEDGYIGNYPYHFKVGGDLSVRAIGGSSAWFASHSPSRFRIISRAPQGCPPKLLRDMTNSEIGALVKAQLEGKTIQTMDPTLPRDTWKGTSGVAFDSNCLSYRVKPEPKRLRALLDEAGANTQADKPKGGWTGYVRARAALAALKETDNG